MGPGDEGRDVERALSVQLGLPSTPQGVRYRNRRPTQLARDDWPCTDPNRCVPAGSKRELEADR